jgi:hypothetical protein
MGNSNQAAGEDYFEDTGGTIYLGTPGGTGGGIVSGSPTGTTVVTDNIGYASATTAPTIAANGNWSSSVPLVLANSSAGAPTFQTGNATGTGYSIALSGNLSGGGGLNVTGNGTLTVSGNNTYTGNTTLVSGYSGSLFANSATSSLGTGFVKVNGGLLAGNGTITNGANALTVNGLGSIGAGGNATTIGQLTTGAQVWNGNGTYVWKLSTTLGNSTVARGSGASGLLGGGTGVEGTNWDLLNITTGNLSLSTLNSNSPFYIAPIGNITSSPSDGYSWIIAQSAGVNSILLPTGLSYTAGNVTTNMAGSDLTNGGSGGIFVLNTANFLDQGTSVEPSSFTLEAVNFGSSEDLVLDYTYNAAPEPGTAMLVLAGGLPMLMARRRRRKSSPAT